MAQFKLYNYSKNPVKYKGLDINQRINLKSWYKRQYPLPFALVTVRDTECAAYKHPESWCQEPAMD